MSNQNSSIRVTFNETLGMAPIVIIQMPFECLLLYRILMLTQCMVKMVVRIEPLSFINLLGL